MNDALKEGLQQIRNESFAAGYCLGLDDVRREIQSVMNEYPHDKALWAVLGGISRLEVGRTKLSHISNSERSDG